MPTDRVQLYDTTLRDGAQMEGISLSVEDKIRITRKLDELGVHYIEGGLPGCNPKDAEFFRRLRDRSSSSNARLAAFGGTRKPGVDAANRRQHPAPARRRHARRHARRQGHRCTMCARSSRRRRREPGDDRRLRALLQSAREARSSSMPSTSSTASTPTRDYALPVPRRPPPAPAPMPRPLRHQRRHDHAAARSTRSAPCRRSSTTPARHPLRTTTPTSPSRTRSPPSKRASGRCRAASTATASAAATPTSRASSPTSSSSWASTSSSDEQLATLTDVSATTSARLANMVPSPYAAVRRHQRLHAQGRPTRRRRAEERRHLPARAPAARRQRAAAARVASSAAAQPPAEARRARHRFRRSAATKRSGCTKP